jgi:hypothetical protein
MNLIDIIKSLFIICFSSLLGFVTVEYSYRFILEKGSKNTLKYRTMLFESGKNFLNYEGYFKYFPNVEIRSLTLYSKLNPKVLEDIEVEYDYIIRTNNYGLVMQSNLIHNDRVFFVIGDSFTEGQGASPWFYDLENLYDVSPKKLVNLGILGTGPMQWENLARSLTKELMLNVDGSIVNIIPGDMSREVWTFKERELNCLHYTLCDYNFGFQGYNFNFSEDYENIKLSIMKRLSVINGVSATQANSGTDLIKNFVKRSHVVSDLYTKFISDRKESPHKIFNETSLLALKDAANGNLYVNLVSLKDVNSTNFANYIYARELVNFLEINNINYSWCDIPYAGFHTNDGHPNANGYKVLRKCTEDALSKLIS